MHSWVGRELGESDGLLQLALLGREGRKGGFALQQWVGTITYGGEMCLAKRVCPKRAIHSLSFRGISRKASNQWNVLWGFISPNRSQLPELRVKMWRKGKFTQNFQSFPKPTKVTCRAEECSGHRLSKELSLFKNPFLSSPKIMAHNMENTP